MKKILLIIITVLMFGNSFGMSLNDLMLSYGFDLPNQSVKNYKIISDTNLSFKDRDNNNLFDLVQVELKGNFSHNLYKLNFYIENKFGEFVGRYDFEGNLENNKKIDLPISIFFESKVDGPYKISSIEIYENQNYLETYLGNFETQYVSYQQFEKSNLVELEVSDLDYNLSSGEFNFTILNSGNLSAVYMKNIIFAENFSKDFNIYFLNSKESKNYSFLIPKNLTNLTVVLDIYNYNEEFNENNFFKVNYLKEDEVWDFNFFDLKTNLSLNETFEIKNKSFKIDWGNNYLVGNKKNDVLINISRNLKLDEGEYVFRLKANDFASLKIDDIDILNTTRRNRDYFSVPINLTNGIYNFEIDFIEKKGKANLEFEIFYSCPNLFDQKIPIENVWNINWCDLKTNRLIGNSTRDEFRLFYDWGKSEIISGFKNNVKGLFSGEFDFEQGEYEVNLEAKNIATLYIDGKEVGNSKSLKPKLITVGNKGNKTKSLSYPKINLSGKHRFDIELIDKNSNAYIDFTLKRNNESIEFPFFERFEQVQVKIPKSLRDKMNVHHEVEWSLIAQRAFEDYLDVLGK